MNLLQQPALFSAEPTPELAGPALILMVIAIVVLVSVVVAQAIAAGGANRSACTPPGERQKQRVAPCGDRAGSVQTSTGCC